VHVHRAVATGLQRRGVQTVTCQEAGLATASDEENLAFAATENWVVFSQDDDFLKICSTPDFQHKGLVYSHKRNAVNQAFLD
jgi:predicted nuclease of predicted toxin-antitoxin system